MLNIQNPTRLPDLVVQELERRVKESGTQKMVAEELDISPQHLGDLIKGKRTASPALLEKLDIVRITFHVKKDRLKPVINLLKMALAEDAHFQRLLDKVLEK